jgi:methionine sulfoxide reductase heme-binding subunit
VHSMLKTRGMKAIVLLACLAPFGWLTWRGLHGDLTSDPITYVTHFTGDWTLRFLLLTLAITPLRRIFDLPELIRFRRMLGLFAFFYGSLHFTTWIWPDHDFAWSEMSKDVLKRPFITVGFTAFVLLIPLALTSTAGWIRRLGGRRWQLLHRLIYLVAALGVIHYYWLVKSDVRRPLFYGFLLLILLAWRLGSWLKGRRDQAASARLGERRAVRAETT